MKKVVVQLMKAESWVIVTRGRKRGGEEAGRRGVPIRRKRVRTGNCSFVEEDADAAPTRVEEFREVITEEAETESAITMRTRNRRMRVWIGLGNEKKNNEVHSGKNIYMFGIDGEIK